MKDTYFCLLSFSMGNRNQRNLYSFSGFPLAALLQKLPQGDQPLLLRLIAGPDPDQLSFILKENETGEVEVSRQKLAVALPNVVTHGIVCKLLLKDKYVA